VTGALVTDTCPLYPTPLDLVEQLPRAGVSRLMQSTTSAWELEFPSYADISTAFLTLGNVSARVNERADNPLLWTDEAFLVSSVYPVAHQVLSLPRTSRLVDELLWSDETTIRESVRVAMVLFLGLIKRRWVVKPDGIPQNRGKVSKLLQFHPVNWSRHLEWRLWVLVISALVEDGVVRAWFVSEIAYTMINLGIDSWSKAYEILNDLVWIEGLVVNEIKTLGEEVELVRVRYPFRTGLEIKTAK
jgi:hypothetical protein